MKRYYIEYENQTCPVDSINWGRDEVGRIGFVDAKGKFHCAFQTTENQKEGYDKHGLLRMDIKNRIFTTGGKRS